MTLLFAGHDTTTSTLTFLFYELARNPAELARLEAEVDARRPTALPRLEMAIDETLRLYPPAWVGPRRSIEPFESAACGCRADSLVNYCSWASHRLPEVFPEPDAFPARPLHAGGEGGAAEGRLRAVRRRLAHLHRDALRPAGDQDDRGALLRRCRLELADPALVPSIRQMPTLSPRGGLPMVVRERA